MEFVIDTHTHTIASGHAYNTILEMAKSASEKGLRFLGITDHAPKMPGSTHRMYFSNFKVIPRELYGVEIAMGCELNILDFDGTIDLPEELLSQMDVTIASIHTPCFQAGTVAENTRAMIRAIENPYVNIIGHPDDSRFPVDYKELVAATKANHKLLELNNNSLNPAGFRKGAEENDTKMLLECMRVGQPIIVNSDAHWIGDVANHAFAKALIAKLHFPEELIMNCHLEEFKKYIQN